MLLGAILGAAISGKIADYIGRRDIIMGTAALFVSGPCSPALTHFRPELFTLLRLAIGLALGAISRPYPCISRK